MDFNFPDSIEGEFVILKKVTLDDAEDIYRWRTSKSGLYLRQPDGYSLDSQRKWILSRGTAEINYIIFAKKISKKVGTIGIYDINSVDKIANVGRLLLDEYYLTKSNPFGLESLKILYGYLFEEMKFHKMTGDILGLNINMYKLQLFLGMKQEGFLKKHVLINGVFQDLYIMSIFNDEFPKFKLKIDMLLKGFKE